MGYNRADYFAVRDRFSQKYLKARQVSEERRAEIHAEIPEIFEIDKILSKTGVDIMRIITGGGADAEASIAELEKRNAELIKKREELLVKNGFEANYTDVQYECEKCGDTGYVDTVMCDCMKKALIKAGYESSGLGTLIGRQTFDKFELGYYTEADGMRAKVKIGADMLRGFAESFDKDTYRNFIIIGTSGLGKTHLSTAVAQAVIDRGFDVYYASALQMFSDFEHTRFGSGIADAPSVDVSRYSECELLILDDLGTEVTNQFTNSCLYLVINNRINLRRPTIISTNLSSKEIKERYTDRIASRILGDFKPLLFVGTDVRRQKMARK
jgi:DNA replication protein DnaC